MVLRGHSVVWARALKESFKRVRSFPDYENKTDSLDCFPIY